MLALENIFSRVFIQCSGKKFTAKQIKSKTKNLKFKS